MVDFAFSRARLLKVFTLLFVFVMLGAVFFLYTTGRDQSSFFPKSKHAKEIKIMALNEVLSHSAIQSMQEALKVSIELVPVNSNEELLRELGTMESQIDIIQVPIEFQDAQKTLKKISVDRLYSIKGIAPDLNAALLERPETYAVPVFWGLTLVDEGFVPGELKLTHSASVTESALEKQDQRRAALFGVYFGIRANRPNGDLLIRALNLLLDESISLKSAQSNGFGVLHSSGEYQSLEPHQKPGFLRSVSLVKLVKMKDLVAPDLKRPTE